MTSCSAKHLAFFENARLLQNEWGIVPLMYGSLGLEYLTGQNLCADDVDILIPRRFLQEQWPAFKALMASNGYTLTDEHEHAFEKDGVEYAYAQLEELESFASIPLAEIPTITRNGVAFRLLSLAQYLQVYTASAKDGYRVQVRQKKDHDKIAMITRLLNQ